MPKAYVKSILAVLLLVMTMPAAILADGNEDQLNRLNSAARAAYAAGKAEVLAHAGPVIIVGSDITFLWDGQQKHESYTPEIYTTVKSLTHLWLGTAAILEAFLDDPVLHRDIWAPHLEEIRAQAAPLLPHLNELGLDQDGVARNRYIVERVIAFIDQVLAQGNYSRDDITRVGRALAPLLLANANEAAKAQVDLIHSVIENWRASVSPEVWNQVYVIVQTPRMPRAKYLQYAYFRHAMGEDAVEKRLIFAENIFDQDKTLGLLGTVLIDRRIANLTFGNAYRLDEDVLGDAAEAYLLQLFGNLGQSLPQ